MTLAKCVARVMFGICIAACSASSVGQEGNSKQPSAAAASKSFLEDDKFLEIERRLQNEGLLPKAIPARIPLPKPTPGRLEPAMERITVEVLLSLEERRTLVVWLLDQTMVEGKLERLHDHLSKMRTELGLTTPDGKPILPDQTDGALLNSVIGFGKEAKLRTDAPTGDLDELQKSIAKMKRDDTGQENVFSAVSLAVNKYKGLTKVDAKTREPKRNVMLVVFTDEPGDDQHKLDQTIKLCRQHKMPVYVLGVPAPFGQKEAIVKWVDPDPMYDQTPQWARMVLGPESLLPERLKLHFAATPPDPVIDSGFGPFALTRLCHETGGIYFALHTNRRFNRPVSADELASGAAHLKHFFDPNVLRKYRPDYVSQDEYKRLVSQNKTRQALVQASTESRNMTIQPPRTTFLKKDDVTFAKAVSEAQKQAARLEPQVDRIYQILKAAEEDREREKDPRWQAGYDLALGQTLATRTRAGQYNAMLALLKRGTKFKRADSNTWILQPADEFIGGNFKKTAKLATEQLQRVIDKHQGTPWAFIASQELKRPVGWKWTETTMEVQAP